MLKTRIITAVTLLVLFLAALFGLPALVWSVLVTAIVMQGTVEWTRLAAISGRKANLYWWLTLAAMLGMVWLDLQPPGWNNLLHVLIYALSALFWLIIVPIWLISGWKVRQPLLMAAAGWILLIPTGLAMMDLRAASPWWLLGAMSLVWMADISAYFSGHKFGKTRLAPNISPGKTWEGVAGALIGVSAYVILIAWLGSLIPPYTLLPGLLLVSWFWVSLAVVGDLFESAIKRQAGVKDSGTLLPGHGGLLDRIDALTSTLPLVAMMVMLQRLAWA